jgi:xeroderma pigmentosum group C-complementing protein
VARLKAYWEAEHAAALKEQEKRHQAVLNRWTKLVQGLRIRQRVREQYGGGTHGSGTLGVGDVASSPTVASGNGDDHDGRDDEGGVQPATVGGFLMGVEDVVQSYSLPRPTHVVFSSPPRSPNSNGSSPPPAIAGPVPGPGTLAPFSSYFTVAANNDNDEAGRERGQQVPPTFPVEDVEEMEMDNMSGLEREDAQSQSTQRVRGMPKSMAALAAEAEAQAQATTDVDVAVTSHISEGEEAAPSTASRSLRSATRATPRTKPRTRTQSTTKTKTKTKTTTGTGETPSRSRSRSRKRTRTQDDDNDEAAASGLGSESGSDGEEYVNDGRPRVAKRARKHQRVSPADAIGGLLAPVPPSDRVLRTRKGK